MGRRAMAKYARLSFSFRYLLLLRTTNIKPNHWPGMMINPTPLLTLFTATAFLLGTAAAALDPIAIKVWQRQ